MSPVIQNPRKTVLFLALVSISLFALAQTTSFETARGRLSTALDNWQTFTPDSQQADELSLEDYLALQEQQQLNHEASQTTSSHRKTLDQDQLEELSGVQAVTYQTLEKNSWSKGFDAARRLSRTLRNNVHKAQKSLGSKPEPQPEEDFSINSPPPYINTGGKDRSLHHKLDELKAWLLEFDEKNHLWELNKKAERARFDQRFIEAILGAGADYSAALAMFSDRLTDASSAPTGSNYQDIYAELILLHLYLRPMKGLRLVNLGLRTADELPYTSDSDQRFETQANVSLSRTTMNMAKTHTDNLPQALAPGLPEFDRLTQSLEQLINKQKSAMLTLLNSRGETQTAVALTAVLFDLYNYQPSAATASTLASTLKEVGWLWDFRTCWYTTPATDTNIRITACFARLSDIKPEAISDIISTEVINPRPSILNKQNNHVAHQWYYGAAALRLMTGASVLQWRKGAYH